MAKLNFNKRKYGKFATGFNKLVGFFAKKAEFSFTDGKPESPCIITCNHTSLQAPFAYELFYGEKINFWSNAKLFTYKNAIHHFRTVLAKVTKLGFLMPLAYVLMPLINFYYKSYDTIPVWHDLKVKETYNATVKSLEEGNQVIIFAETKDTPYNEYILAFQRGFAYSAYYYYKATGKTLKFYPSYCDVKTRRVLIGEPTEYNPDEKIKIEAERITVYLEKETTKLAKQLLGVKDEPENGEKEDPSGNRT